MGLIALPELLPRGVVDLPPGDNSTDTIVNGVHFNTTALRYWNYTLYSNNTLSNNSKCYLVFDQFKPTLLSNGSFVNATTCYVPIFGIRTRGKLGITFATLFTVCLLFTLVCLKKHGQQYIREDKRFRMVGRRWQWYWMIFTCACGLIGTLTSVDVDRNYLQEIAIILQSFFFFLMYLGLMSAVWEATRHWGSWQERQIVDRDSYALRIDDHRARVELYLPLVYYFFVWLNFFMIIPRSWTAIQMQRSPDQQAAVAKPAATDGRFKAGAIIAVAAFATILYQLKHHLHYYRPHEPGIWGTIKGFCKHCPTKILLAILVLGVRVAYGISSAWVWESSVMKYDGAPGWLYGAGYTPIVLVLVIFCVAGLVEENEDRQLIMQRHERGKATDAELGIIHRPHWWKPNKGSGDEARLRELTDEFANHRRRDSQAIEMASIRRSSIAKAPLSPQSSCAGSSVPSPVIGLQEQRRSRSRDNEGFSTNRPLRAGDATRVPSDGRSDITVRSGETAMTGTTLGGVQKQRVRSMLDVG